MDVVAQTLEIINIQILMKSIFRIAAVMLMMLPFIRLRC